MQITESNITLIKPKDGLIGFASVVVNGGLYLSGIGIHRKLNGTGYRLTYPTKKVGLQNTDIFHPINRAVGQAIEDAIFNKLNDVMNRLDDNAGHHSHCLA